MIEIKPCTLPKKGHRFKDRPFGASVFCEICGLQLDWNEWDAYEEEKRKKELR